MILEHGRPSKGVVSRLSAVTLGLFGSLCRLGDKMSGDTVRSLVLVSSKLPEKGLTADFCFGYL